MLSRQGKADLFLFSTTFIWGSTFVLVKTGLESLSPLLLVAVRFTLAAAILIPIGGKALLRAGPALYRDGFGLGFLIFLGFVLQTWGLQETTAANSAFITGMMVIFTPLFQLALLKRPPRPGNLVGVAVVSAGLWLLTQPASGDLNQGDFLTLLCAIVFALYIVRLDQISRRHPILPLTFVQILAPAVYAWIALPFLERASFDPTVAAVTTIVYLAVLATIVTGYIQTRYQRDTTPTRAVLIFTLEPLWAAGLGYVALQEVMRPEAIVGGALILAGILISELFDGIVMAWSRLSDRLFRPISKPGG